MAKAMSELSHLDVVQMMAKENQELRQEIADLRQQFLEFRTQTRQQFSEVVEAHTYALRLLRLQQAQNKNAWKNALH